jgi:hypothetical protein
MDKCINDISTDHFRLRSLRRKKRSQRQSFHKNLLRLYKEERSISRQIGSLGYEELDPPVQRGWKRYFVLREDVARSKDAKFFQGILDKMNTTEYSWKKDFKVMRKHRGKKIYVVRDQELEKLWPCSFKKKKFTEKEEKYFDLVMTNERVGKHFIWLYRFQEPWRFRLKVEPNMIKRAKIKNFDLERRANEISQYLGRNNLRPKMLKVVHGRYQWRLRYSYEGELPKYEYHPFRNRSFAEILDEYLPDQQKRTIKLNPRTPGVFHFLLFAEVSGNPSARSSRLKAHSLHKPAACSPTSTP